MVSRTFNFTGSLELRYCNHVADLTNDYFRKINELMHIFIIEQNIYFVFLSTYVNIPEILDFHLDKTTVATTQ